MDASLSSKLMQLHNYLRNMEEFTKEETFSIDAMKDYAKWPVVKSRVHLLLENAGPSCKECPLGSNDEEFPDFHFSHQLSNGEHVKLDCLLCSTSIDSGYCFCFKLLNFREST